MKVDRIRLSRALVAATVVLACATLWARPAAVAALPDRLSDAEFWKLETDISEPGGYFRITDNYTSNENEIGQLMTQLVARNVRGGVYLGVGPEQNLSYIAALRPDMAFVCDIRRQAVVQHLMFKAIFEMAADRTEFISLLFAKPKPAGVTGVAKDAPIQDIWNAFGNVRTDDALAAAVATRVKDRLMKTHGFRLNTEEQSQLSTLLDAFVAFGPSITTRGGSNAGRGGNSFSFADLTGWSTDATNTPQSFLSTDERYQFVKTLQERNLLVPVSGDFGGPHALRAIGDYLKKQGATLNAFYVSNVEQYLFMDGKDTAFYANVATLPVNDASVFIRPYAMRQISGVPLCAVKGFLAAASSGHATTNYAANTCGQ